MGLVHTPIVGIEQIVLARYEFDAPDDADVWWGITDPLTGALYPSGEAYRNAIADFADGYKTSDVWTCA